MKLIHEDFINLGFSKLQLKGSKQFYLLPLSYHQFKRIKYALIIRGSTLFIVPDYEYIRSVWTEHKPEYYFKRLWEQQRINFSQASYSDLIRLIKEIKNKIILNSSELIKTIILAKVHDLFEQSKCNHEFIEIGYGYKCENCDYYTGINIELNTAIKKELEETFLKRQHEPKD